MTTTCPDHGPSFDLHGACTRCRWQRPASASAVHSCANGVAGLDAFMREAEAAQPKGYRCCAVKRRPLEVGSPECKIMLEIGGPPHAPPHRDWDDAEWLTGSEEEEQAWNARLAKLREEIAPEPQRVPVVMGGPVRFETKGGDFDADEAEDVADVLARVIRERDEARRQLAAVQARCTEMLERRNILRETVRAWSEKMGLPMPSKPTKPDVETVRLRARLIIEEAAELLEAMGGQGAEFDHGLIAVQQAFVAPFPLAPFRMQDALDGAIDLQWVIEGTLLAFGIDSGPALAEVARSNGTKTGAKDATGKITKGPAFEAPDLGAVLRLQGWTP